MNQTKLESRIEIFLNYLSGFIIAYLVYKYIVMPTWLLTSPFWTTGLFTVVSIVRSYYWRRFFATDLHKAVHRIVRELF